MPKGRVERVERLNGRSAPLRVCFTLVAVLLSALLSANLRKEFQALEKGYEQGKLSEVAAQMLNLRASSDEEKALMLYLSAMLKVKRADTLMQLQQAIEKYPSTHYGQLSMLHKAKLHILEREAAQARSLLARMSSTRISQRYYWLAVCAEMTDDPTAVISNVELYLRVNPGGEFLEEGYFLMAEAYMEQKKFQSAATTLGKLAAVPGYPTDAQYFHYLSGYAYHQAGDWQEALSHYQRGIQVSRYTQIAYQIEDRLFELKDTYKSKIDLSFLFPYSDLDLPEDIETPGDTPPIPLKEVETPADDQPLRANTKPESGLYVQTGRFGVEANARSVAYRVRQLKLPAGYFEDKSNKSVPWVTFSGPYKNSDEQQKALDLLKQSGVDCFAVRY